MSHPQPAELSAEEPDEWQPHAPESFQEIGRIGQIAIALLGASTVTHLLATWSDWNTYGVVNRYLGGEPNVSDADLNRADTIARLTSVPNVVISVAAAVVFVLWLWRARVNSEVFCQADHRHSHGWVLASWFCPGPNLWYPKQIVDDVWTASDPRTPAWADDLRRRRPITVTAAWWGCWVGAMVFDIVVRRVLMWIDPTVGVLRGIAVAATVSLLLTGASAVFAALLIRQITAMQTSRHWIPWWDQREPARLTAVPSYAEQAGAGQADATQVQVVLPSLRLERQPELQFAGAVGGEAPRCGSAPVSAPAANRSDPQATRLTAVPASPLQAPLLGGGPSPLMPAAGLGSGLGSSLDSPLDGPLGSPWPTPRPAEPEREEAPAWSPFAPMVESWREAEPTAAESPAPFSPEATAADPQPSSFDLPSSLGSSAGLGSSPLGSSFTESAPDTSWARSSEDPLSRSSWRDETPDWRSYTPPALTVVPPLPVEPATSYKPYSTSYDSEPADYLAPSAPIPAIPAPVSEPISEPISEPVSQPVSEPQPAEQPVRRSGRRAAAVAVDSPSTVQRQPEPSYEPAEHPVPSEPVRDELVQAPLLSGLPSAAADEYLTPSKPLPPVPTFGPEPSYDSYQPYSSSYSTDSSDSYSGEAYGSSYDYSPEPAYEPSVPAEEPAAKPVTPRVHPRRRWS